jgi:transposase InsO family protein
LLHFYSGLCLIPHQALFSETVRRGATGGFKAALAVQIGSLVGDAKLIRSMSRKGCSPDNSACEGFFGRLKNELFYSRSWQATTIEQFIQIVDSYIHWYNEKRIKISLGALSPLEYRQSLGLMTQTSPSF